MIDSKLVRLLPVVGLILSLSMSTRLVTASSPSWKVVSSPNVGTGDNYLFSVAVISSTNIWAVGSYFDETLKATRTLIEHWNGASWGVVPSPNRGTGNNSLTGLAVVCSTDIWAVGEASATISSRPAPLLERWNGTKWTIANSPAILGSLSKAVALSASSVWAVGASIDSQGNYHTLIEHWNGVGWSIVSSPSPSSFASSLTAVATVSATNVWAVGSFYNDSLSIYQTLIEHWNGASWSIVPSPNPSPYGQSLSGVTVLSSSDIWAVGEQDNAQQFTETLTEHWNGSSWSVVPGPSGGPNQGQLIGVTAVSSNDVWAVGGYCNPTSCFQVQHWNGSSWSNVPSPQLGNPMLLLGIARVPGTNQLWSVGYYPSSPGGPQRNLIEHYS